MIAVIIERFNRSLSECFGEKSIGEIPFFDTTLSEVLCENSIEKHIGIVLKIPEKISEKELQKLKILLGKKPCERVLITYSDVCFFGENPDDFVHENQENFIAKNKENKVAFCVVDACFLLQKLEKTKDDFSSVFKTISKEKTYKNNFFVVENPLKYKALCRDVLLGRLPYRLPEVAQGIYTSSAIPKGDFVIVPPVYFGDDIQIEKGCVIGPDVIISDGVLVADSSRVSNCLIGENSYVSSECRIEGCLISTNVVLRRNSTLLSNSVLCHDVTVGEDSVLDGDSFIRAFSRVDNYGNCLVDFKTDVNNTTDGFYGYTPESAARLGAAVGICFDMPKIGVACDGELNSTALKLAFLGGLITTGGQIYDFGNSFHSSLHYFMDFCQLDCAAFFNGNDNGTLISLFRKGETGLSKSDFCNIKSVISKSEIPRCSKDECKNIRQIHGMQRMYVQSLTSLFKDDLAFCPVFISDNPIILGIAEAITSKIGFNQQGNRVEFNINSTATKASVKCEGVVYPHSKLLEIVSFFERKYSGIFKDLFNTDSLILSFYVMKIITIERKGLRAIAENMPRFYVAEKSINTPCGIRVLAADLSRENKIYFRKDEIIYKHGLNTVKINQGDEGVFCIRVKSSSMEAATEFIENLTRFISERGSLNY